MRRLILPLLVILSIGVAFGQEAILTTTLTYPDTLVASTVGARASIPIFLTYKDALPPEVLSELQKLNVTKVYIIGGPAVVSEAVEDALVQSGFEVVRLWGMTRFGTACEVATYFWPEGSPKIVITWDQIDSPEQNITTAQQLALAKELAIADGIPVLIIPRDTIPWAVAECMLNLRVRQVKVVGDIGENARRGLSELNISIEEEFTGNLTRIQERVRSRIRERVGKSLIVAAVGNWTDVVRAPYHPGNGTVRLISSEAEISQLIEEIKANNYTQIKIVGKPELAQRIWEMLSAEGVNATPITPRPLHQQVIQNVEEHLPEMQRIRERLRVQIQQMTERMEKVIGEVIQACVDEYNKTVKEIEEIEMRVVVPGRPVIVEELNRTRNEFQRRLMENRTIGAYESCLKLRKLVHLVKWKANEIKELVDIETKPFNITIGVKPGDYIKYLAVESGVGSFEITVKILEVTKNRIKFETNVTNIVTNTTVTTTPAIWQLEGPFIPANLSESYLSSKPPFWLISTETKRYLGKMREVIKVDIRVRTKIIAYFDRATGILLEMTSEEPRVTTITIKETNVF